METDAPAEEPARGWSLWLRRLAVWNAVAGGCLLVALSIMTVASILGSVLLNRPIPGDFELMEMGTAVAVFWFLPYCQLKGGNVSIDIFTARAPARAKARLSGLGGILYLIVIALLLWRMSVGGLDLFGSGQGTMVLAVPHWMAFAVILPSLGLLFLVTLKTTCDHWRRAGR